MMGFDTTRIGLIGTAVAFLLFPSPPAMAQLNIMEAGWSLALDVQQSDDANVTDASSVDFNPLDGNFYFGERNGGGDLFRWLPDGTTVQVFARNNWTGGLAVDPVDGAIYVADDFSGTIVKYSFDAMAGTYSSLGTWVSGFGGGDDDTAGIAMVPATFTGALNLVSPGDAVTVDRDNAGNDSIFRFSRSAAQGEVEIYNDNITTDSFDIAVNDTQMVITDDPGGANTGAIYQVINDGVGGLTLTALTTGFDARGVTFDPLNGDILFTTEGGSLVRLKPGGQTSVIADGFGHTSWGGVALSDDGARLVVTSWSEDSGHVWELRRVIPEPGSALALIAPFALLAGRRLRGRAHR